MPDPFVGLPTVADSGCAFSAAIDVPSCGEAPTAHIAVESPGWGTIALASCATHAPIGRASGRLLAEHPYKPECETTDCWAGVA